MWKFSFLNNRFNTYSYYPILFFFNRFSSFSCYKFTINNFCYYSNFFLAWLTFFFYFLEACFKCIVIDYLSFVRNFFFYYFSSFSFNWFFTYSNNFLNRFFCSYWCTFFSFHNLAIFYSKSYFCFLFTKFAFLFDYCLTWL